MAESAEHEFLSKTFLSVLEEFSQLELFGYREADRRAFDFACDIQCDWQRALVGQTLWKHGGDGINKDLDALEAAPDADIWAYIVLDTAKNRTRLGQVIESKRRAGHGSDLHRLKVMFVPAFDLDDEDERACIASELREQIVRDILFGVVFGGLGAEHVRLFLSEGGSVMSYWRGTGPGLNVAILQEVATSEYVSQNSLASKFDVSQGTITRRLDLLKSAQLIHKIGWQHYASLKGRGFLAIVRKVQLAMHDGLIDEQLLYLLRRLGIDASPYVRVLNGEYVRDFSFESEMAKTEAYVASLVEKGVIQSRSDIDSLPLMLSPEVMFAHLHILMMDVNARQIDLSHTDYRVHPLERDPLFRIGG